MDTLIKNGYVLVMDDAMQSFEGGSVLIRDGLIRQIFASGESLPPADIVIDATDCIVMPGLVNTHSHLPMTYFRGLADDLPLDIWLNHYIWPLEAKLVDNGFVYDATLHGAAEMIRGGIVLTNDMYFELPGIADACLKAGLRVVISDAILDIKYPDAKALDAHENWLLELDNRYCSEPLISFAVAPHAIYTCSSDTLKRAADIARKHGFILHMHLAETQSERDHSHRICGKAPVHYLKDLGVLDNHCVFAHGVWVDESEMELLADSRAAIALCTDSNLKLASGLTPIKQYQNHGVSLALATDGVASNNNLDLLNEMDLLAKTQKHINKDPSFLKAEELVRMATIDGAKALGMQDITGSLEPGKSADLIVIDSSGLEAQPLYNPYSHLVYAISSSSVRDVFIQGRQLLRNHCLTSLDQSDITDRAKYYKQKILQDL